MYYRENNYNQHKAPSMKKIATKYFCAIRSVEKQPKTDGNFRYTDRPPFYHSFSDKISFLLMQG